MATKAEISFFENIAKILSNYESDKLRVLFGYSDQFLEWLKNQDKNNNVNIVSDH